MGASNHRMSSVTTYPFNVFGGLWSEVTPNHLSQLPFKGDIHIGNDVWIGRESIIMPGVSIGNGAIIAAHSIVTKDVEPYSIVGGNPIQFIKKRFDEEMIELLLDLKWWNFSQEELVEILPLLCSSHLKQVKKDLKRISKARKDLLK